MTIWNSVKAAAVAAVMGAGVAGAATLDAVDVADSPQATGMATLVLNADVIMNIIGVPLISFEPADMASSVPALFNSTVSTGAMPEITGFVVGPAGPGTPLLAGDVVETDVDLDQSVAQVLYRVTGGSASGDWGPFAVLSIDVPGPNDNATAFTLSSATEANVVPLPAGGLLLLSGAAGLALFRRR